MSDEQVLSTVDVATCEQPESWSQAITSPRNTRVESCRDDSHEGVDDMVRRATGRTNTSRGTRHARTTSRSGVRGGSDLTEVRATNRAADDTRNLRTRGGSLRKVLSDMGQRDVVEGDETEMTMTAGVGVPGLDLALLGLRKTDKGDRIGALTGELDCCLNHVTRSATVVGARAGAVLSDGRVSMRRIQANAAGAVHGTLELRQVVRTRKGLLRARVAETTHGLSVSVGEEQARTAERSLLHDGRVAELLNKRLTALDGGIGDLSSLGRAKSNPGTTLDAVDERNHAADIGEVDEGIAHIATGLEVNAKVHEVVGTEADIVENGLERHLWIKVSTALMVGTGTRGNPTQSSLLGMLRSMMVVRTSPPSRMRSRRTRLCWS